MNSGTIPPAVTEFYRDALNARSDGDPVDVLERVLAEDFRSRNSQETKDKATLKRQFAGLWKMMPDLKFEPQEMLAVGDRVIVRSVASGSPSGPFMGVETDGSRSFRIDTIDIHLVVDGRIAEVFHVEDWMTAIRQVRGH
jgi:predicted ester cyclase